MNYRIRRLREQRATLVNEARAILDAAEAENRELTGDETQTYERHMADVDQLDEQARELEAAEQRRTAAEQRLDELVGQPGERRAGGDQSEAELRAFLRGEGPRSFVVQPERRDLVVGTAAAGGNTVPTSFYGMLVEHMTDASAVLSAGPTILTTASGEPMEFPKTVSRGAAARVGEGAAIPESDPAFGKVTLGAFKAGKLIQLSPELINDTGVNLTGYVAREAGMAVGDKIGLDVLTGNGDANNPLGVLTAATLGKTGSTGAAGAMTWDDMIDLFYSVIGPYRRSPSCGWLVQDGTEARLSKLKDAEGRYIWQPSVIPGTPDTIKSKPVRSDPNMPAVALSARSVLFGDFSRYFVRLVGGIRFERSDDFAFANDLVTYRVIVRYDGDLIDTTGAIKYFQGAAS